MKRNIIVIIILSFVTINTHGQQSGDIAIPLTAEGRKGKLYVDIKSGSITILGTNRKDILVKYDALNDEDKSRDKKNDPDGLKKIQGGTLDLEITENNNTVKIESNSWNNGVNLTVEIPGNFDLSVKTYNNGDIVIKNVTGNHEVENYNGSIEALDIAGSMVASTYNGEIKAVFRQINQDTPMAFTTYNGAVDLTLPGNTKGNFKMKSENGEILSGFDLNIIESSPVKKEDKKYGTYKVYLEDWIKGTINGGGPEFMIKNYNGDIYIRKGN